MLPIDVFRRPIIVLLGLTRFFLPIPGVIRNRLYGWCTYPQATGPHQAFAPMRNVIRVIGQQVLHTVGTIVRTAMDKRSRSEVQANVRDLFGAILPEPPEKKEVARL